ncbi:hypothetical protein A4S06_06540 [Erysipelotrichaceae bacterium MTC7]|nr:hypothetical protein A4S06_06540 [Erysipelotrichaceae bacterium MTC7]OFA24655.1 hypothetical protein BW28_05940 [Clostridioides difficile]
MAAYLPAFIVSIDQNVLVEVKGVVSLKASPHVEIARNTDGTLLVHDVGERRHRPALSRSDALVLQLDVLLVVEGGKPLVAVKSRLVRFRHFPDHHGNRAAFAFLNREVGACLASLEKQLPARKVRRSEDRGAWAAHPHLRNVEVAAVSDVVSLCHSRYRPF